MMAVKNTGMIQVIKNACCLSIICGCRRCVTIIVMPSSSGRMYVGSFEVRSLHTP